MRTDIDTELLERAAKLDTIITEHAAEAEQQRRLPRAVRRALADAGLFRLLTPRTFGGLEADPVTAALAIETVARIDSAAGWALMTGNSVDWWCARLPAEGPEELYRDGADVILAAAFHPPMQAVEVDGGFEITGRAPLASNVHDAAWVMVTAIVMDGGAPREVGGAPVVIAGLAGTDEIEILDTWYSLGMRGTDSHDVAFERVFVPVRRTFPLAPEFEAGPAYRGPLYRIPGMAEVSVVGPTVVLGIARRAVDELRALAERKTPFGSASVLRHRSGVQAALGRAEALLRSARAMLYGTLEDQWEQAQRGIPFTLEQRADVTLAAAHATASATEAVEAVFAVAGTSGIYAASPIERAFRDVQTLRHHGFFSASRYETAGQVFLDVEPEFGLVAF